MEDGAFKLCPFCKEQIRKEAIKCRFCGEWLEQTDPDSARTTAKPVLPPPIPPQYHTNKQAELHTIKVGGRTIVLPEPDNGCQRCDHLGKPPLVPFSFRQRLLAFFVAGDATPTQARYFYVQCARFMAGMNETRETYEKLQAAIVRHDQGKGSIFDVTDDSLCLWVFYAPINMIFTSCMMLIAGRVLHLYVMCHRELTSTEREQMVMKSWRERIIKANPDDRLSSHDVIGDSCMSECEEIATSINSLVKAGYIPKAQELLDSSLDDYFVLQLAMFADKNVNAHITIAAWKQAGLRLPAEDTAEFYPYGDSPEQEAKEIRQGRGLKPGNFCRFKPNTTSERIWRLESELIDLAPGEILKVVGLPTEEGLKDTMCYANKPGKCPVLATMELIDTEHLEPINATFQECEYCGAIDHETSDCPYRGIIPFGRKGDFSWRIEAGKMIPE